MNKNTQETMFSSKSNDWATPQHLFDKLETQICYMGSEHSLFLIDPGNRKHFLFQFIFLIDFSTPYNKSSHYSRYADVDNEYQEVSGLYYPHENNTDHIHGPKYRRKDEKDIRNKPHLFV